MRFSDTFLEEIRQRLPITQVVGEYVTWDKRKSQPGRGDMWANCPFHGEKTPSFHADDRKGIYHCFGCGVSGDHFRFLTEHAGMSFPEAVEKLAATAGIAMPARDEREEKRDEARRTIYDVLELATAYFEAALQHNIGARARGYLHERSVTAQAQNQFRIGFAPDSRNGLKEHLAANGVSAQDMDAAGLVVQREGDPLSIDRFRNRLMFPIIDYRGRVIAFGGRALAADVPAKYLNSPETELFHKRRTLYNIQLAREATRKGKPLIVVEGYLDVIAAVSAGFDGAVAPLGTALTEEHLEMLWRMSETPVVCLDGDEAGQRAAERTAHTALTLLTPGKTLAFATLPEGQDPDDLIRDGGTESFAKLIKSARPLSDILWSIETRGVIPDTPEARASLEARLRDRANSIADNSVRRHYAQAFNERLNAAFAPPQRQRNRRGNGPAYGQNRGDYGRAGQGRGTGENPRRGPSPRLVVSEALRNSRLLKPGRAPEIIAREASIILCLVNHPSLAEDRLETLAALEFESSGAKTLLSVLIDIVSTSHDISGIEVVRKLEEKGYVDALNGMRAVLHKQGVWQADADVALLDAETGLKHALALHYKSVQLNRELRAAEMALGSDLSDENLGRLRDIQNQLSSVDGTEALIEGFGSLSGRAPRTF